MPSCTYIENPKEGHPKVISLYHPPTSIDKGRELAQILLVNGHWLPIVSFNRLMGQHQDHAAFCSRCLRNFYYPDRLEHHKNKCYSTMGQVEVMPLPKKAFHTFEDWSKMLVLHFAYMLI